MKRVAVVLFAFATLFVVVAVPPAQAAPTRAQLTKQNAALTSKVNHLKARVTELRKKLHKHTLRYMTPAQLFDEATNAIIDLTDGDCVDGTLYNTSTFYGSSGYSSYTVSASSC